MVTRISHMTLFVRDQKTAYDVYVNRLGFRVDTDATMENGVRWLTVNPPGQPDVQVVLAEPQEPMVSSEMLPHIRALLESNSLGAGVFECDDCRRTYEELRSKGIEFTKEPTDEFYGTEAVFKDGCGNWFSLTEHRTE